MYSPADTQFINEFLNNPTIQVLFIILTIWSLIWKGIALWKAAHHDQRNWFIALLVTNTFGILEIVYIFYFQKKNPPNIEKNS